MKVLVLTRYVSRGASSRLRILRFLPALAAEGFEFDVHSLLGEAYLGALYTGRPRPVVAVLRAYLERALALARSGRYDLIWMDKEALPWLPVQLERFGAPVVVDYDDATFHRYDQHRNPLVRRLLGRKIDRLMARAAVVIVANSYLEARARASGARCVQRLPTCVDLGRYKPKAGGEDEVFTVGWIGTPHTASFLPLVAEPLRALANSGRVRFRFIGAPADLPLGFDYVAVAWSEQTEVAELHKLDCGIMPLPDRPFERGKSGFKLIQYMACGLPVVASPVGANNDIVQDGVNGYLPATSAAWLEALERLRAQPALRDRLGAAGRKLVEAEFDSDHAALVLTDVLRAARA